MMAVNSQPILEVRKKGLKPAETILVSLIGRLNERNHTVYADPRKEYDWSWAVNLARTDSENELDRSDALDRTKQIDPSL